MTKAVLLLLMLATLAMAIDCDECARSGNCSAAHTSGPGHHCGGYDKLGHRTECCCGVHQECVDPTLAQQCRCTTVVTVPANLSGLEIVVLVVLSCIGQCVFCGFAFLCYGTDCPLRCRTAIVSLSRRIVLSCSRGRRSALQPTKRSMRSSHTLLVDDNEGA